MTRPNWPAVARTTCRASGFVIVVCFAVLTHSYVGARRQEPRDKQRLLELQEQVQQDASLAAELAAEHDRMTKAQAARKAAGGQIAIVLIVASAAFLTAAKYLISRQPRRPVAMSKLVRIAPAKPSPDHRPAVSKPRVLAGSDETDLSFVEELIAREGQGREAAIPILQAIQTHYRYLPDEALRRVCELTEITPAQIAGTSSFYAQFRRSPVGKHIVRVCHGTACHVSGARQITDELRRHLQIPIGEDTDPDRMYTIDEVACFGCCSLAPVMMIDEHTAGNLTPTTACDALDVVEEKEPA